MLKSSALFLLRIRKIRGILKSGSVTPATRATISIQRPVGATKHPPTPPFLSFFSPPLSPPRPVPNNPPRYPLFPPLARPGPAAPCSRGGKSPPFQRDSRGDFLCPR